MLFRSGGTAVAVSLPNGETSVQSRQPIQYDVSVADVPSTGGVITATLTNAQWADPTATNTQTYCQAYGGTFALSSDNSVWTCLGLTFSASLTQASFTPTAFAPTSSSGRSVGLTVTLTTSNGSASNSAPSVPVTAGTGAYSIKSTLGVSGQTTNIALKADLLAQTAIGTPPLAATPSVTYTLLPPANAQTCSNPADGYGGASCTGVTSVPYTYRNQGVVQYPNVVNESTYDTTTAPALSRANSQPGGPGTPVTLKGTPRDNLYPSPTYGGSTTSNFVYTGDLLSENVSVDATWLSSLRYPAGGPAKGSYPCTWSAVSNEPTIGLSASSGACGTMVSSTDEGISLTTAYGTGSYNPVLRVFPGSDYSKSASLTMGPIGTVPVATGAVACLKFDNARDTLIAPVDAVSGLTLQYGSGNWGTAVTSTDRSTYEMRASNCASASSVPQWYASAQVDFTNSNASGTLINANQINAIRAVTTSPIASGSTRAFVFGPAISARGTDARGAAIAAGDRHIFVLQGITSSGVVFDSGQCAGADDSARTCPVPGGPAIIPGVLYGAHGYAPMSVDYTLNGDTTSRGTPVGYTPVYTGGGVTGQYLTFKIRVRGSAVQAFNRNANYAAAPTAGSPATSVPNVVTKSVLPLGVNVDCGSIVPAPDSCVKTGSGASVQYTVIWTTSALDQDSVKTLSVPGSIDSQTPSGSQDVKTTITAAGQQPQVDDTSYLRFTAVKQNQPTAVKTAGAAAILEGDASADWSLILSTPASIPIDSANAFDILPYDGDPLGSIVKGTYAIQNIDNAGAAGSTIYVSSRAPAQLDVLDGRLDGYLNPQTSEAGLNSTAIASAFSCALDQVGIGACPTLDQVTAINVRGSNNFLPAGTSKAVKVTIASASLIKGDLLNNAFAAQLGSYVTIYSAQSQIAVADPSFSVQNTVSPSAEVGPGATATYTVVVKNTGNVALPFRSLTPTITEDLSGLLDDTAPPANINAGGGVASISGNTLTWTPAAIPVGGSATLTFTARVNAPPTGDLSLKTKVSAPVNTYATTPSGLDCPPGSTAARCSTNTPVALVPTITSPAPPATAVRGTAYNFTVKATGYTTPTFALAAANTLPVGLTLNQTTGVISGTPTVDGTYTFRVVASNSSPNSPTTSPVYSITVGAKPAITSAAPPTGTVGAPYAFTVTASGSPAPTYAVSTGTLPTGLSLDSATGVISGTPTTTGSFTYSIVATNALGASAASSYTTTVASVPAITSGAPASPATVGSPYSHTVTASGSPAPTFTVSSGSLPTGLSLNSASGVISGTPTTAGTFSYSVSASNGAATSATAAYTTNVASVPVITSATPPSGAIGSAYTFTLTATGSPAPTFAISAGVLPSGLALNGTTGVISGTPSAVGSFTYSVTASNSSNASATKEYTTVVSSSPALTSPPPTTPATVGTAYSYTFTASGTPAPTFTVTAGTLPTGLSLNAVTGVLSGTPTTSGSYSFTVKADNGVGAAAQSSYTITVVSDPIITSTAPSSPGTVGTAYSFTVTASGSPAPTFTISAGFLPEGLVLAADGRISGVPTKAETGTFTIKADNGSATPATANYTISVFSSPVITSGDPTSPATAGVSYNYTVTATGSPAPTFSVSSGALPTGLSLSSSSGVISGTPTTAGSFPYTVTASNGAATSASKSYTTVVASVPSITSGAPTSPATIGTAYSFTVTASGSPAPTFSVGAGTLPTGLSLNTTTGVISGSPSETGSFDYTITASNGAATSATQSYTTVVASVPVITSAAPSTPATVGSAYSFTIEASGSPEPTFVVSAGALPTGLALNPASGVISGTPTTAGSFEFTVTASNGSAGTDSETYTLVAASVPVITSGAPTSPVLSEDYSFSVTASGSPAPTFSVSAGALPTGLTLDPDTGVISGSASSVGTFTYTIRAANTSSAVATKEYTTSVVSAPALTSAEPTTPAVVGSAYSFRFAASGSPAPTFSVTSGTLPAGLSLAAATGVLSGTPTAVGLSTFTVTASNGVGGVASGEYSIDVISSPKITSGAPTSPATVGAGYSFTVTASGAPASSFTVSNGELPDGLALDSASGIISGTPTKEGTWSFTITADNGAPTPASETYGIAVGTKPAITSAAPPTGTVANSYSFAVSASGVPAPTFEISSGELPQGLTLNTTSGVISGTPTVAGSYTYSVVASNVSGSSAPSSYTTVIASVPVITSGDPTGPATAGTAYSFTVTASGSPAPTFAILSGALPAGLALESVSGVISGTPNVPGSYSFTVAASNGASASATATYSLEVASNPVITSAAPPTPTVGKPYTFTVKATGSPAPTFAISAGSLPTGLSLNPLTGVISGTASDAGSFFYVISASNGSAIAATQSNTTVAATVPSITSAAPPSRATVGAPYSFTVTAAGSPAPTFSISAGALPTGLTLDSATGVISGTPTDAGSSSFTVTASNTADGTGSASYDVRVTSRPSIVSGAPVQANEGQPYRFEIAATGEPAPTFTITSGSLPAGVTLDPATGVISGTPTTPGSFPFAVSASNGSDMDALVNYTLVVASRPAPPTPPSPANPPAGPSARPLAGPSAPVAPGTVKAATKLTISPADARVAAGDSLKFTVTAYAADGTKLGDYTQYATLRTDVKSDTYSANAVQFVEAGAREVTARIGGLTVATDVVVEPNYKRPRAGTIQLVISDLTVTAGETVDVTVEGEDVYGNSYGDLTLRSTLASDRTSDRISPPTDSSLARIQFSEAGKSVITVDVLGETDSATVTVTAVADFTWTWWLLLLLLIPVVWWIAARSRRRH